MTSNLQKEIEEWLNPMDYWQKYAGSKILKGELITEEVLNLCLKYFEEDNIHKIKSENRESIIFKNDAIVKVSELKGSKLKRIQNIKNVNALTSGQEISIGDSLTVIYGNNGSGKSSYTRLLNNAFCSRGDMGLMPNVYNKDTKGSPTCEFVFDDGQNEITYLFPNQKNNLEFSKYAVFDSTSSKTHLDKDNNLLFIPNGFDFFNKKIEFIESLKAKLEEKIVSLRKPNKFINHFKSDNAIYQEVLSLNEKSNFLRIKALGDFNEEDEKQIRELIQQKEKLNPIEVAKQIKDTETLKKIIIELKTNLQSANSLFGEDALLNLKSLFSTYQLCEKLLQQEGIENLKNYEIEEISSNEWKTFIESALFYVEMIGKYRFNEHKHENTLENCPFCLQPLHEHEIEIINKYWILLKSQAAQNLKTIAGKLNEEFKIVKSFTNYPFENGNMFYQLLSTENEKEQEIISEILRTIKDSKEKLLKFFELKLIDELPIAINIDTSLLLTWENYCNKKSSELESLNLKEQVDKIDKQIEFLNDKKKLLGFLPEIESFIENSKWITKAEAAKSKLKSGNITHQQGILYSKYITDQYAETFSKECINIEAPSVVEINQKSAKGQTLRRLKIKNYDPSKILSEGEQRAIALADFLTEIQMDDNNQGVIFDDPVTSLDDNRRKKIAERFVLLSQNKQVIIFTHDIAFFHYLGLFSKKYGITPLTTTIRRLKDEVGIVKANLPWIAQNIKDRIGYLKNELVRLKKVEKEGNEDDYTYQIKAWYGLLREGWERGVEERLFKGVIERFRPSIETQRLSKIDINEDIKTLIKDGMGASEWVHDAAQILNPQIPDTTQAERDLEKFKLFSDTCKSP